MSKVTQVRDGAVVKIPTQGGDTSTIPDNSISEQKLQDLSVSTPKIQNGAITSEKLSDDTIEHVLKHYKNHIINGDMRVAQRGTSFVAISSNAYSLDRWRYGLVGTAVHTVSQDTDVPTVAQSGQLFTNSLRMNLTTPDTSIAAGDVVIMHQRIEGFNWAHLAQKPFTLSFWVKATLTGTYCISIKNGAGDISYISEYSINSSDVWEYKTVSISASPSTGTWNYANGIGLQVVWVLAAGSNFYTTPNAWQTGNFFATSNQVNGVNTGATDFRITGVMLNKGEVAVPFRSFGESLDEEFAACQRYLWRTSTVANSYVGSGYFDNATAGTALIRFAKPMRTSPTLSVSASANLIITRVGTSAASGTGATSFVGISPLSALMGFVADAASTAGFPTAVGVVLSGYIQADAEL